MQFLNEKYRKVTEQNKQFKNPEQHTNDKYYNQFSPYYIEGLTDVEWIIAAGTESSWLRNGAAGFYTTCATRSCVIRPLSMGRSR
jgi:hypothetical protein